MKASSTDYRFSHTGTDKGHQYDASFYQSNYKRLVMQWEKEKLLHILQVGTFVRAMDFACGTGRITRILTPIVDDVSGVDVSDSMLQVARRRSPSTDFVQMDVTREKLGSESAFDLITAFRFFTNAQLSLREEVFKELAILVRPGGSLIFNLHMNSCSVYAVLARVRELIFGKRRGFSHLSLKTVKKEYLDALNLEIVSVHGFGIIPIIREEKILPKWYLRMFAGLERVFAYIPGSKWICKYQIVHCRKRA